MVNINIKDKTVSSIDRYMDNDLGARIMLAIKPLHTGEIFGLGSKIIYFIVCLIATLLPFTGFVIWFRKRSKKQKKRKVDLKLS